MKKPHCSSKKLGGKLEPNMCLRTIVVVILIFEVWFNVEGRGRGLSYDFYETSCPQVEDIVRASLQSLSATDPTSPAALLRLMFHDCQVQGCDASILADPNDLSVALEMSSAKNYGIRKRESISMIKSVVETACPQQVSCADILILAAREAVAMSGGPRIRVPLGRRDSSTTSTCKLADASLPSPNQGVDGMLRMFSEKGMTIEESVAIIGAHTLGVTHCFNILNRLYIGETRNMEPGFELLLRLSCPLESTTSNTSFVVNDPTTLLFDNQFYINAVRGRGVLRIDAEMSWDPRTAPFLERFGADEDEFFRAFSSAFVKLSGYGVLTGDQGVIRKSCDVLN